MVGRNERRSEDTAVFGIRWDGGRRPRTLGLLAALIALLLPAAAQAAQRDVLVVPEAGKERAARALVCRLGGHAGRRIGVVRGFSARVPAGALARLQRSQAVRIAAADAPLSLRDSGADGPATAMKTVRDASGASALQAAGLDGSGVGVALVDSGTLAVPGLDGGQLVTGPDFSADARDPDLRGRDAFGHGTHLAGVIAGHDGDFAGIAPGAHVVSVKVATAAGETSLLRVLSALDWVGRHRDELGIRVVNLSLGVDGERSGYVRDPLAYAVETLWRSGLVVVTAAGNNGASARHLDMPAADPFVVAVGAGDTAGTATRSDDHVAAFSSSGSAERTPDLVAPGTGVVSLRVPGSTLDRAFPAARVGDRFFRGSGTSQAAAVVSGLAALLLQAHPELAPDQVKDLLERATTRIPAYTNPASRSAGAGAVDAGMLLGLEASPLAAVTQRFPAAVLDVRRLARYGMDENRVGAGNAEWAGRTWSGRTWSGRTWSGRTWSGRTWSGAGWVGDEEPE